jgi:hypothetical protein
MESVNKLAFAPTQSEGHLEMKFALGRGTEGVIKKAIQTLWKK